MAHVCARAQTTNQHLAQWKKLARRAGALRVHIEQRKDTLACMYVIGNILSTCRKDFFRNWQKSDLINKSCSKERDVRFLNLHLEKSLDSSHLNWKQSRTFELYLKQFRILF